MLLLLLLAAVLLPTVAVAQDVHVRVSPDVKTGIESTTEYPTIQMALDHHPFAAAGGRVFIEIAPGTYHERVIITQNHTNITLLGMGKSPKDVVITNSLNAKQAGGTFFTETVEINGTGFEADKVTFETSASPTGPGSHPAEPRPPPDQTTGYVILNSKVPSTISRGAPPMEAATPGAESS